MKIQSRFINGLVFGIHHQYYLDFDALGDEGTFEEKMKAAPRVPMVFVYIGPLMLILTW